MFGQQPKVTSKSLDYLEDTLEHEALAYKKCMTLTGQFQDQNLINMAQQMASHHRQKYDSLLNYLQSHQ